MIDPEERELRNRLAVLAAAVPVRRTTRLVPRMRTVRRAPWVGAGAVGVVAVAAVIALAGALGGGASRPSDAPRLGGAVASADNGPYRLTIGTDAQQYQPNAPIEATATFEYMGPSSLSVAAGGPTFVGFGVREVDGTRHADPFFRMSLVQHTFQRGIPVTYAFSKSGSTGADPINDAFVRSYLGITPGGGRVDPILRLPNGRWQLFAVAPGVALEAAVTVEVIDTAFSPVEQAPLDPAPPPRELPGPCEGHETVVDRANVPLEVEAKAFDTIVMGSVAAVGKPQWNTPTGAAPRLGSADPTDVMRLLRIDWSSLIGDGLPTPATASIPGGSIGCHRFVYGDFPQSITNGEEFAFFMTSQRPNSRRPDLPAVGQMWRIVSDSVMSPSEGPIPVQTFMERVASGRAGATQAPAGPTMTPKPPPTEKPPVVTSLDPESPPEQVTGACIDQRLVFDRFDIPFEMQAATSETVILGRIEAVGAAQWNTPTGETPRREDASPERVFRLVRVASTQLIGKNLPNPLVMWIQGGQIGCDRLSHGDYPDDLAVGDEFAFFSGPAQLARGASDFTAVRRMWAIVDGMVVTEVGTTIPVDELIRRIRLPFEGSAAEICDASATGPMAVADSSVPITVSGAFDVTADDVAAWLEAVYRRKEHPATSQYRDRPGGTREVVCFLDGTFDRGIDPEHPATRMVVIHEPGSGRPSGSNMLGPAELIPVEDPRQFSGSPSSP